MEETKTPMEPTRFEALCAEVGDFEPLPTVPDAPADTAATATEDEQREPLDGLILAGLVSP